MKIGPLFGKQPTQATVVLTDFGAVPPGWLVCHLPRNKQLTPLRNTLAGPCGVSLPMSQSSKSRDPPLSSSSSSSKQSLTSSRCCCACEIGKSGPKHQRLGARTYTRCRPLGYSRPGQEAIYHSALISTTIQHTHTHKGKSALPTRPFDPSARSARPPWC